MRLLLTCSLGTSKTHRAWRAQIRVIAVDLTVLHRWPIAAELNPAMPSGRQCDRRFTSMNYFRVYLPWALPQHVRNFLYVDFDTIFIGDVAELLSKYPRNASTALAGAANLPHKIKDLRGGMAAFGTAAVTAHYRSAASSTVKSRGRDHSTVSVEGILDTERSFRVMSARCTKGIPRPAPASGASVINAGVMVINALAWRQHGITCLAETSFMWEAGHPHERLFNEHGSQPMINFAAAGYMENFDNDDRGWNTCKSTCASPLPAVRCLVHVAPRREQFLGWKEQVFC